jgi:serine/threonine protein kinase
LKVLLRSDWEEFQREVRALQRFNGFSNQHMVTLLMTWTMDGQYNMLFPLAECDLDEYWQNNKCPHLDTDFVMWMSKQIVGIADALKHIHDPPFEPTSTDRLQLPADYKFGTHGDVKPENILLYPSPTDSRGVLVVADLGLARLNSAMSKTQTNSRTPGTPRYKPPECSILGALVKRNYDIWTFGCLLLEWVCWAFEGDDARGEFMGSLFAPFPSGSQADMFFDMVNLRDEEYDVIVKPQVVEVSTTA